jgi:hypothetical protein
MAQTIGSVTCDFVKGYAATLSEALQTWQVPGLDGVGAQRLGRHTGRFQFRAIKYDTLANVEAWGYSLEALTGSVITAEDDRGIAYAGLLVQEVVLNQEGPKRLLGAGYDYRHEALVAGVVTTLDTRTYTP